MGRRKKVRATNSEVSEKTSADIDYSGFDAAPTVDETEKLSENKLSGHAKFSKFKKPKKG